MQDVTSTVFYQEFGEIMMRAPVIGLEFTRYLPVALVPFVLLQVCPVVGEYIISRVCVGDVDCH